MKPIVTSVINVFPEFAHIQWTIEDPNNQAGKIEVLRSTSPEGPYETIAELDTGSFFYRDFDPGAKSGLGYPVYYAVRVTSLVNPSEKILSDPRVLNYDLLSQSQPHRDRLLRRARHDLSVTLKRLNGSQFLMLKRRLFGPRCSTCYNPATQDAMISRCGECYGTTIHKGYCDPIKIWAKIDPSNITSTFGLAGSSDSNIVGLTMLDYPLVDPGDLLVECSTNKRFLVARKMATSSSGIIVHQDLQVSELVRYAIEYSVPVSLI